MKNNVILMEIDKPLYETIQSVQYDRNSRFVHVKLLNNSLPFDLTNKRVILSGSKPDGEEIFNTCKIEEDLVIIEITEEMNAVPGISKYSLEVYGGDMSLLQTKNFKIRVTPSNRSKAIESRSEVKALNDLISEVQNIDNRFAKTNAQLSNLNNQKADKSQIGTPLVANSVAEMTDLTKVYVNTINGHWYSYNGGNWVDNGIYQSQGISDGSISPDKTDFVKSSYQYLNNVNLTEGKYYWLNGLNVEMADNSGYKVFAKLNLKSGTYYFKDVIPVFSFIKNTTNNATVKLEDVLTNMGDKHFTVDYNFDFYATVLIDANEAMLSNVPLTTEYKVGAYDIVIDGIGLRELNKEVYSQRNEISELKAREELKENSIETDFIKDKQVTVEKTDFIENSGNYQFLQKDKIEQAKYYWYGSGNLNVGIADHQDYKIHSKLTLKAGVYYFTPFVNAFSFIKNLQNDIISPIDDVINDGKIIINYDSEIYLTYSIGDDELMLADGELPLQYIEGTYNVNTVICECNLTEMNNNINNLKNEINSLKNEKVTAEKTDFITISGNNQFLQKDKFEQGKYYWLNGLDVDSATHNDYKIYPKLTLTAGSYSLTSLVIVFSYIKNLKTGDVLQLSNVVNSNKITTDYDFELYLTYSTSDDNSMVTNGELPPVYVEGVYNEGTTICGYNLTEMKQEIKNLNHSTATIKNEIVELKNTTNDLINNTENRIFKCGKNEQFTKIKDAIEEASKYPNSTLYVASETFDLVEEYGQDYLDNYDGREFGMHPHNGLKIIFDSGAKIVFDYKGSNKKVHEFFAPINAQYDGGGFELVNAWIESKNCRYSVHDEHAGDSKPYRNIYRHCTFIHDSSNCSWGAHQAIGGGLGTSGDILVEDCLGIAVGTDEVFSWHNAVTDHPCKSNIVVRGCYLEGSLGFGLQGTYTDVTNVFVSNCSLTRNPEVGGAPGSAVNMKLYEWNNEIRNN